MALYYNHFICSQFFRPEMQVVLSKVVLFHGARERVGMSRVASVWLHLSS